jgi:hypothetical protein
MVESEKAQKEEAYVQIKAQLMVGTMMGWLLSRSGSVPVLRWMHEVSVIVLSKCRNDRCRSAGYMYYYKTDVIDQVSIIRHW